MTAAGLYEASPVKRVRRTRVQLAEVDDAIVAAVSMEHPVTLRGVYYRVVSAGAVDKTEAGYQLVQRQLLKLRQNRTVPYSWITDGTRMTWKPDSWTDLDQMLHSAASSYRKALWDDQRAAVIVLSEKDAISGAIYPVTAELDVELAITRGYSSETFTHSIAETIASNTRRRKVTYVYQVGDHDPSGVDAWRSFQHKVLEFAPQAAVEFQRVAVTPRQMQQYDLPTRPVKKSDTRAKDWTGGCVEVDALPPTTLRAIVRAAIEQHLDPVRLRMTQMAEASERELLYGLAGQA